jgi:secondary thiamine-phosphate synthase enzyme
MEKFNIKTNKKEEFIDITAEVQSAVKKSKIDNGICYIYVPHTTCGLTINENADPSVRVDIISKLKDIVPDNGFYRHTEGNSPAHIKSSLMGHSINVLVEDNHLSLGTWQGIFLCEFDGPRTREVWVKI